MNRFDRVTAILVQLHARRAVQSAALAEQFGVSLRTIYRDLRTLETAGIPIQSEAGVGYSLADGYRLPPATFTRPEAAALLTAEKLAAHLTDSSTAQFTQAAMAKLRAVLRHPDRDYLEQLSPYLQILRPHQPASPLPAISDVHQQLLDPIVVGRVVRLQYQAGSGAATVREVEPLGLYLGQQWHVVAFCRLRQEFRDFRLDRITELRVLDQAFPSRPDALAQYWQAQAARHPYQTAVVEFRAPAARLVQDTKYLQGWVQEEPTPTGGVRMTFRVGCLRHLAGWLLPLAGQLPVVAPPVLGEHLRELAQAAHQHFCPSL
ncbi:MAG: helix-turn-helix transcriptional regulator [Janthinobacterium lividum]